MSLEFEIANSHLLDELVPYLVATPWNRPNFDMCPFGLRIPEQNIINPLHLSSERFLVLLERLDSLTFGPEGMPMPRWVFYVGSELPGGIMGFAREAEGLTKHQRELLELESDYTGLVPFSMYIAIPMIPRINWMGHNLASLNPVFPELGYRGLASLTKGIALRVYRAEHQYGATQWESKALNIHTKFGPLDLITAYTPAHSEPMTLTYRVRLTDQALRAACGDAGAKMERPKVGFWLEAKDVDHACRLQDEIEAGAQYQIVDRPVREDGKILIPLA